MEIGWPYSWLVGSGEVSMAVRAFLLQYLGLLLQAIGSGYESLVPDPYKFEWLEGDRLGSTALPDVPGVVVVIRPSKMVLGPFPVRGSLRHAFELRLMPFDQTDAATQFGYVALKDDEECDWVASHLLWSSRRLVANDYGPIEPLA